MPLLHTLLSIKIIMKCIKSIWFLNHFDTELHEQRNTQSMQIRALMELI